MPDSWQVRAERLTPGASQTRSKAGLYPNGPTHIVAAQGAYAWDDTGRRYIDWIAGLASVGLGYAHPEVNEAVLAVVRDGNTLPLPSPLEADVAEQLLTAIRRPNDMVRWVKTGSEATDGAILIARKHTNRRRVLSVGYHGWHCIHQTGKGLGVLDVPWGDLDTLGRELRGGDVACVLMEPMRDHVPPDGYLAGAQAVCRQTGTLYVLDEIVTGFRWAVGGATETFGLDPDIVCYGKAMANGYPLGAIVGRREIMEPHARAVSSTFGGERVGLAAAQATMRIYARESVIETLWATGRALQREFRLLGYPVHPRLDGEEWERRRMCQEMALHGVLWHPAGVNPMYAHTDADVIETIRVLQEVGYASE